MACGRLGTGEDKVAVEKAVEAAVTVARFAAPDLSGAEVRAAFERGGMSAVLALQAERAAARAARQAAELQERADRAAAQLSSMTSPWGASAAGGSQSIPVSLGTPANNDFPVGYIVRESTYQSPKNGTVEVTTASGTYLGVTPNPRKTEPGIERGMRTDYRKDNDLARGDDVGHLLGLLFGVPVGSTAADIAGDARNASAQNWRMNQGQTYRGMEDAVAAWLKANPHTPLRVSVEVVKFLDRDDREVYRQARFETPDGSCPPELDFSRVHYLNPKPGSRS